METKWKDMASKTHWPILDKWLDEDSYFIATKEWEEEITKPKLAQIYNWLWSPDVAKLYKACQKPTRFTSSMGYAVPENDNSVCIPSVYLCRIIGNGLLSPCENSH